MFVQWQCISQRGLMLHLQSNYRVVVVVVVVVVVFCYAPDQTDYTVDAVPHYKNRNCAVCVCR